MPCPGTSCLGLKCQAHWLVPTVHFPFSLVWNSYKHNKSKKCPWSYEECANSNILIQNMPGLNSLLFLGLLISDNSPSIITPIIPGSNHFHQELLNDFVYLSKAMSRISSFFLFVLILLGILLNKRSWQCTKCQNLTSSYRIKLFKGRRYWFCNQDQMGISVFITMLLSLNSFKMMTHVPVLCPFVLLVESILIHIYSIHCLICSSWFLIL